MMEKERIIKIMKALSDARFEMELIAGHYGDSKGVLQEEAHNLTVSMRRIGTEYLSE